MNYNEKKEEDSGKDFLPARSQEISKIFKPEKVHVSEMQKMLQFDPKTLDSFRYNFRYEDGKKNGKLTKYLWKGSYRMHYSFPN